ncbi:beta-glucoside-specific PTS transporter subunit IIABC [Amphibacillus sp. Q70]|uniref:beta-glucoside-specific PTS transporter subunit IIABC n=1 Tax=Amphibacillus sp. Q70 TaxID=3453416 RepID=UPI003F856F46
MSKEIANQIVDLVGGKDNITDAWHCATRLRMFVNKKDQVDVEKISHLKGVVTAQFSGEQLQIIIGSKVAKVYAEVIEITGPMTSKEQSDRSNKSSSGVVSTIMETISGIFTPILPVIAGAGLLKGLLTLSAGLEWLSEDADIYKALFIVADCAFYFLPFLLASSAAKIFKTNNFLALAVAGSMFYPTIMDSFQAISAGQEVDPITLFGFIDIPFLNYSSSVIPIILGVWLLSYVEPAVKKVVPKPVSIMFTPMITLIVVILSTLIVLGPLGNYIGEILAIAISWLFDNAGIIAGLLMGATMPLIIMTGMHYALFPLVFNNFALLGHDKMLNPVALVTNVAQSGAAFAVAIKSKNKEMKELATSSGVSALLGITEPAMYGINLKLKRPFYACLIAGGISGAIVVGFGLKSFAFITGIISLTAYVEPGNPWNLVIAISGFILSFVLAFVLTFILGFEDIPEEELEEDLGAGTSSTPTPSQQDENTDNTPVHLTEKKIIASPATGKAIPIENVNDKVFSKEIMGVSYAVTPNKAEIVAPIDGEIVYVADSKHAIGLKTKEGIELLIHMGIDTVELKGKYFDTTVKATEQVSKGTLLATMEVDKIAKTYDPTVITVITNSQDFQDMKKQHINQEVTPDHTIFEIE